MVNDKIGMLAAENATRDAIHVAVAPVIAHKKLHAGDDVGVNKEGTHSASGNEIGIVDPFLKKPVKEGERFYLWLYPNTVTDMHHHWTHPAFDCGETWDAKKDAARKFIETLAEKIGHPFDDFDSLMAHVASCLDGGDHYVEEGHEGMRMVWYENKDEFWKHYETLTGVKHNPDDYLPVFCCTC